MSAMGTEAGVMRCVLAPFLAILVALAAGWLAWIGGAAAQLDVGAITDETAVHGFFNRERNGSESYRWGKDDPQLIIGAVPGPALLMVRMAGRPNGLTIAVQGATHYPATFAIQAMQVRRYALLVAPTTDGHDRTFTFAATAQAVLPEPRRLSVLVAAVRLEPLRIASLWPPVPILAQFGWFGLMVFSLPRLICGRDWLALLIGVLASIGLAWAWGVGRTWVAPYLLNVVSGVTVLTELMGLLRIGARSERQSEHVDGAGMLVALLAAGGILPAWHAVAYLRDGQLMLGGVALAILPLALVALIMRRRVRLVIASLAIVATLIYAGLQIAALIADAPNLRSDFHALLRGAARQGFGTLPLYNLPALARNPFGNTFNAPPSVALLLQPVALIPLADALSRWRTFSVLLLVPTLWLLLDAYRVKWLAWPRLGALVLIATGPGVSVLRDGQIGYLLLACLGLTYWGMQHGYREPSTAADQTQEPPLWYERVAGIGLGLLVGFNPSLLPLLLVPVLLRRGWMLTAALGSLILLTLVAGVWIGYDTWLTYLLAVLPLLTVGTGWIENQSLAGFVNRIYTVDYLALQPGIGGIVPLIWGSLALALLLVTARITRPGAKRRADLTLGLWLVALLLALPSAWIHVHILLVPIIFMVLVLADRDGIAWTAATCVALAWVMIGQGDRFSFYDETLHGPFWQMILSFKTFGLLLLYLGLVLLMRPQSIEGASNRSIPMPM